MGVVDSMGVAVGTAVGSTVGDSTAGLVVVHIVVFEGHIVGVEGGIEAGRIEAGSNGVVGVGVVAVEVDGV